MIIISPIEQLKAAVRKLVERAGPDATNLRAEVLALVEKPLLEVVLDQAGGNHTHAAAILGVSRNHLRALMRQHGIPAIVSEVGGRPPASRFQSGGAFSFDYRSLT